MADLGEFIKGEPSQSSSSSPVPHPSAPVTVHTEAHSANITPASGDSGHIGTGGGKTHLRETPVSETVSTPHVTHTDKKGTKWAGEAPDKKIRKPLTMEEARHTRPSTDPQVLHLQQMIQSINDDLLLHRTSQDYREHDPAGNSIWQNIKDMASMVTGHEDPYVSRMHAKLHELTAELNSLKHTPQAKKLKGALDAWQLQNNSLLSGAQSDIHIGNADTHYNTVLDPEHETLFHDWFAHQSPMVQMAENTYDLRGLWKHSGGNFTVGQPNPHTGEFLPEAFKKPNNPTFSRQSIYAKDLPDLAGSWVDGRYKQATPELYDHQALANIRHERELLNKQYPRHAFDLINGDPVADRLMELDHEEQTILKRQKELKDQSFMGKLNKKCQFSTQALIDQSTRPADHIISKYLHGEMEDSEEKKLFKQTMADTFHHHRGLRIADRLAEKGVLDITVGEVSKLLGLASTWGNATKEVKNDNPLGHASLVLSDFVQSRTEIGEADMPDSKPGRLAVKGLGYGVGAADMAVEWWATNQIGMGILQPVAWTLKFLKDGEYVIKAGSFLEKLVGWGEKALEHRKLVGNVFSSAWFAETATQEQANHIYGLLHSLQQNGIPKDAGAGERKFYENLLKNPDMIPMNMYASLVINGVTSGVTGKYGPEILQKIAGNMADKFGFRAVNNWFINNAAAALLRGEASSMAGYSLAQITREALVGGASMAGIGALSDLCTQLVDHLIWNKDMDWKQLGKSAAGQGITGSMMAFVHAPFRMKEYHQQADYLQKVGEHLAKVDPSTYGMEGGKYLHGSGKAIKVAWLTKELTETPGGDVYIRTAEKLAKDPTKLMEEKRKGEISPKILELAENLYALDKAQKHTPTEVKHQKEGWKSNADLASTVYDMVHDDWNPLKGTDGLNQQEKDVYQKVLAQLEGDTKLTDHQKHFIASMVAQRTELGERQGQTAEVIRAHVTETLEKAGMNPGEIRRTLRQMEEGSNPALLVHLMHGLKGKAQGDLSLLCEALGNSSMLHLLTDHAEANRGIVDRVEEASDFVKKHYRKLDELNSAAAMQQAKRAEGTDPAAPELKALPAAPEEIPYAEEAGPPIAMEGQQGLAQLGEGDPSTDTLDQTGGTWRGNQTEMIPPSEEPIALGGEEKQPTFGDILKELGEGTDAATAAKALFDLMNSGSLDTILSGQHVTVVSGEDGYVVTIDGQEQTVNTLGDVINLLTEVAERSKDLTGQDTKNDLQVQEEETPKGLPAWQRHGNQTQLIPSAEEAFVMGSGEPAPTPDPRLGPNWITSYPGGYENNVKVGRFTKHNSMDITVKDLSERGKLEVNTPVKMSKESSVAFSNRQEAHMLMDKMLKLPEAERILAIERAKNTPADPKMPGGMTFFDFICDNISFTYTLDGQPVLFFGKPKHKDYDPQHRAFIEYFIRAGGNPVIKIGRSFANYYDPKKAGDESYPHSSLSEQTNQEFMDRHPVSLAPTGEDGTGIALVYEDNPDMHGVRPKVGIFSKSLGKDDALDLHGQKYFGEEQEQFSLVPLWLALQDRLDDTPLIEEWKELGVTTDRDDLSVRELLSYFMPDDSIQPGTDVGKLDFTPNYDLQKKKVGKLKIDDPTGVPFEIRDGETLLQAYTRNGLLYIDQNIRYPFVSSSVQISCVVPEPDEKTSKKIITDAPVITPEKKKTEEEEETKEEETVEPGSVFTYGGGKYTHITSQAMYDSIIRSLAVQILKDYPEPGSNLSILADRLHREVGFYEEDSKREGISPHEKAFNERAAAIRKELLENLVSVNRQMEKVIDDLRESGAVLEEIEYNEEIGQTAQYLATGEGLNPFWRANQRLLAVISSLQTAVDPRTTFAKVERLPIAKKALMSILGGKVGSWENIIPLLRENGGELALSFANALEANPSLLPAAATLFTKEYKVYTNALIGMVAKPLLDRANRDASRHTLSQWNRELLRILALPEEARAALAQQCQEISNRPVSTLEEKAQQLSDLCALIGIDVSPDVFISIGKEHPLEYAFSDPKYVSDRGARDELFLAKTHGIIRDIQGILAFAKRGQGWVEVQKGKKEHKTIPAHQWYNQLPSSLAKLAFLQHRYEGGEPDMSMRDQDGKRVYEYQEPTFFGDSKLRLLRDPEHLRMLLKDPNNARSYYLNEILRRLNEGKNTDVQAEEILKVVLPNGEKKAGNSLSPAEALLIRWQATNEGAHILRQVGVKRRTTVVHMSIPIPREYFQNPSAYAVRNWVAAEAQSVLQARKLRDSVLDGMTVEEFDRLSRAQQETRLNGKSPKDLGLVETAHFKWVQDGDGWKISLAGGKAYEPTKYKWLNDLLSDDSLHETLRNLEAPATRTALKHYKQMIADGVGEYVRQLADYGYLRLNEEAFAGSKIGGLDAIIEATVMKTYGRDKQWLKNPEGEAAAESQILCQQVLGEKAARLSSPMRTFIGAVYRNWLNQTFSSIELDPVFFGSDTLYGGRANMNKRLSGEFSTGQKFALSLPPSSPYEEEFRGRTTFKVLDAFDWKSDNTDDYLALVAERVGTLQNPSRVLRINLDRSHDGGNPYSGKTPEEVYDMTLKEAQEALKGLKSADATDGQSFITPAFAREMNIRLGRWTAAQEKAWQAYKRGEATDRLNLTPMKCMYWGPESAADPNGGTVTGYAFYKTCYQPLVFATGMDPGMVRLIEWMEKEGIGIISFGSANKVFGQNKTQLYKDGPQVIDSSPGTDAVRECSFDHFRWQLPTEPHESEIRRLGIQLQKNVHDAAAKDPVLYGKLCSVLERMAAAQQAQLPKKISDRFSGERGESNLEDVLRRFSDKKDWLAPPSIGEALTRAAGAGTETTALGGQSTMVSAAAYGKPLKLRDSHGLAEIVVNAGQLAYVIPAHLPFAEKRKLFEKLRADLGGKVMQIGYRVPTTGTASVDVFNILDIVDDNGGTITIAPNALKKKDGHDDDADKNFSTQKFYHWSPTDVSQWTENEELAKQYHGTTDMEAHRFAAENRAVCVDGKFLTLKTAGDFLDHVKAVAPDTPENQLVDVMGQILRSPAGAACNTSTVDGPTTDYKDALRSCLPKDTGKTIPGDAATLVRERALLSGDDSINMAALSSSMKPIIDWYVSKTNEDGGTSLFPDRSPFRLRENGNTELNRQGGFIVDDLGAMVSMTVDDKNDPLLGDCNVNSHTKSMIGALHLEGHGIYSTLFFMQPGLRLYSQHRDRLGTFGDPFEGAIQELMQYRARATEPPDLKTVREQIKEVKKVMGKGSSVMDPTVIARDLKQYNEYLASGTPMSQWDKSYLGRQIVALVAAMDLSKRASAIFRTMVYNRLDAGKKASFGSPYGILQDLFELHAPKEVKGNKWDTLERLQGWLGEPDEKDPYWLNKARRYVSNLVEMQKEMPMNIGDDVLKGVNQVVEALHPGGFADMIVKDRLWRNVVRCNWLLRMEAAGLDTHSLIEGDESVAAQWEALVKDGAVPADSRLIQYLSPWLTQYTQGESRRPTYVDKQGKVHEKGRSTPDEDWNQIKAVGGMQVRSAKIHSEEAYADFMQAILDAQEYADRKSPEAGRKMKQFIDDFVALSYITETGVMPELFPAKVIAESEALKAAATVVPEAELPLADTLLANMLGKGAIQTFHGYKAKGKPTQWKGKLAEYMIDDRAIDRGLVSVQDDPKLGDPPAHIIVKVKGKGIRVFSREKELNEDGQWNYTVLDPAGIHTNETTVLSPDRYSKTLVTPTEVAVNEKEDIIPDDFGDEPPEMDEMQGDEGPDEPTLPVLRFGDQESLESCSQRAEEFLSNNTLTEQMIVPLTPAQMSHLLPVFHKHGYDLKMMKGNSAAMVGVMNHTPTNDFDREMEDMRKRTFEAKIEWLGSERRKVLGELLDTPELTEIMGDHKEALQDIIDRKGTGWTHPVTMDKITEKMVAGLDNPATMEFLQTMAADETMLFPERELENYRKWQFVENIFKCF